MRLLLVAVLLGLITAPAQAAGIVIGLFCLDGGVAKSESREVKYTSDGKWLRSRFSSHGRSNHGSSMMVVFKDLPAHTTADETCEEIAKREITAGRPPLLAGTIEHLHLDGSVFESNSGTNRYQVGSGGLHARLGHVTYGNMNVAGGTSDLTGAKLWIRNKTPILIEASQLQGEFEIEAWNRSVVNARIQFDGADLESLTFRTARSKKSNKENLTFRFDLATGGASIWDGHLVSNEVHQLAGQLVRLDTISVEGLNARLHRIDVVAERGKVTTSLQRVEGAFDKASQSSDFVTFNAETSTFNADQISATASQRTEGLKLENFHLAKLRFDTASSSIIGRTGRSLIGGALKAQIDLLNADKLAAALTYANPRSSALTIFADAQPSDVVTLKLQRSGSAAAVDGSATLSNFALDKLRVKAPQRLRLAKSAIDLTNLDAVLEFPIDIDAPLASGSVDFLTEDYKVLLTGKLNALRLKGVFRIPLSDIEKSHLAVDTRNFLFSVGAYVFLQPFIAGVIPTTSATNLSFTNPTPLRVGLQSEGRILASVDELIVGEPIFRIGENGSAAKASLRLRTQAGADLLYDLAKGRVVVARAHLLAENVRFHFLEPGGRIDLNGTYLSNPDISLQRLEIRLAQSDDVEFGSAELNQFQAAGDRLYKDPDPAKPNEISYNSVVSTPLTIARASALKVRYRDMLSLEAMSLDDFGFGLTNGSIRFGKDISVVNAQVQISVQKLFHAEVNGNRYAEMRNGRFSANGRLDANMNNDPNFQVSIAVSGPSYALNGSGSASLGAFTGGRVKDVDLGFKCEDNKKLKVPTEFNFGLAGVSLAVSALQGDFSAVGQTGPFGVSFHTTSGRECDGPTEKWVIVKESSGWTWGLCGFPPRKCKWKWTTPEINFKYKIHLAVRFATATMFMSNPYVYLSKSDLRACNRGVAKFGAVAVVGGYSPHIVTNYPGATDIVNWIISAYFETIQTVWGTAIVQAVGGFATEIINIGQVICYV